MGVGSLSKSLLEMGSMLVMVILTKSYPGLSPKEEKQTMSAEWLSRHAFKKVIHRAQAYLTQIFLCHRFQPTIYKNYKNMFQDLYYIRDQMELTLF